MICARPNCSNLLAPDPHPRQLYCSPRCRVRAYRKRYPEVLRAQRKRGRPIARAYERERKRKLSREHWQEFSDAGRKIAVSRLGRLVCHRCGVPCRREDRRRCIECELEVCSACALHGRWVARDQCTSAGARRYRDQSIRETLCLECGRARQAPEAHRYSIQYI